MWRGFLAPKCRLGWIATVSSASTSNRTTRRHIFSLKILSTTSVPVSYSSDQMRSFQDLKAPKIMKRTVKSKKDVLDVVLVDAAMTKQEYGDKVAEASLSLGQVKRTKKNINEGES